MLPLFWLKAKKSRETCDAWFRAYDIAKKSMGAPVPTWLRNAPTKLMKELSFGEGQKWEAGFHLDKSYLPEAVQGQKSSANPQITIIINRHPVFLNSPSFLKFC